MTAVFIGIDGGGTSCRAALAGGDGTVRRTGQERRSQHPDRSRRRYSSYCRSGRGRLCRCWLQDKGVLSSAHVVLGLAGANVEGAANAVAVVQRLPFRALRRRIRRADCRATAPLGDKDGAVAILGNRFSVRVEKRSVGDPHDRRLGVFCRRPGQRGRARPVAPARKPCWRMTSVRQGSALSQRVLDEFGGDPAKPWSPLPMMRCLAPMHRYAPITFEFARKRRCRCRSHRERGSG